MFVQLDTWILRKHQDYAEYWQIEHGQNCYSLAYACYLWRKRFGAAAGFAGIAIISASHLYEFLVVPISFLFVEAVTYVLRNQKVKRKYQTDTKIPEEPYWFRVFALCWGGTWSFGFLCLVMLFGCIGGWAGFLITMPLLFLSGGFWVDVHHTYFASCTPLPPDMLRFRQGKTIKRSALVPVVDRI